MNALPTRVKMAEHVQMESTVLPARVLRVILEATVREVRCFKLYNPRKLVASFDSVWVAGL